MTQSVCYKDNRGLLHLAEKYGQRITNMFIRGRVLPAIIMLCLFSGMLLVTGYILWQTKIKEEFSLVGRLEPGLYSHNEDWVVSVVMENQPFLPVIEKGVRILVSYEKPDGKWVSLNTTLIRQKQDVMGETLVLRPHDKSPEGFAGLRRTDDDGPGRMKLVLRQKRLIKEAFNL